MSTTTQTWIPTQIAAKHLEPGMFVDRTYQFNHVGPRGGLSHARAYRIGVSVASVKVTQSTLGHVGLAVAFRDGRTVFLFHDQLVDARVLV